ncbi:MAG: tetratricopeptide repeat protein [Sphingobacteriaceae bacterium]|nr:tetratricopeptide repeat protein [Sphingobacteriaceae bacterium]
MRNFALLLILQFQLNTIGQNIDSLKLALNNAKHDSTKCLILKSLYYAESDNKVKMELTKERLQIAELNLAKNNNTDHNFFLKQKGACFNQFGLIYKEQGDISKALNYHHKSLKVSEEIGNKIGISISLNNIGTVYFMQGDIPKALDYYHKSLKMHELIMDKIGIAGSLNNIGNIYKDQGDHSKAIEYYQKSLIFMEEIGEKSGVAICLNNIGGVYYSNRDTSNAMVYFQRSLKIREEVGNKHELAASLNNIGILYKRQGENIKALEYFHKSLKIQEQIGDKNGIASSLHNIGNIYYSQGNLKDGLTYANKSMRLAMELGFPKNIQNSSELLKSIFRKQNKYKEALQMYELEIKMRDSINSESTRKASIKNQLKYEYEKQAAADSVAHAKESEVKNAEIAKQTAEIKAKKNQQYALFGGLGLVLIFAGVMFNRFKVTQKQKGIIESQKLEVESQKKIVEEKQKEVLDSIHYARRIQMAQIPSEKRVESTLNRLRN